MRRPTANLLPGREFLHAQHGHGCDNKTLDDDDDAQMLLGCLHLLFPPSNKSRACIFCSDGTCLSQEFDGGARGNPGTAGAGAVLYSETKEEVVQTLTPTIFSGSELAVLHAAFAQ